MAKEKHLVNDNERLMSEWNWDKNNELGFDPYNCILQDRKGEKQWVKSILLLRNLKINLKAIGLWIKSDL